MIVVRGFQNVCMVVTAVLCVPILALAFIIWLASSGLRASRED